MITAAELAAEERRLLAQSQELQARTSGLARVPFDRQAHEFLRADLRRHQRELAAYRLLRLEARRLGYV